MKEPVGVDGPAASCAKVRLLLKPDERMEPSMTEISRIAIDTSKQVFTIHVTDAAGQVVQKRNLRRRELLP